MRKDKQLGEKFLWVEKEIVKGNVQCMLGLLEDLRRKYDGMPKREGRNYFIEGPYLQNIIQQDIGVM